MLLGQICDIGKKDEVFNPPINIPTPIPDRDPVQAGILILYCNYFT